MQSAATGTVSGCVVWMLVFCILSTCVLSAGVPLAGLVLSFNHDFMAKTLEPYLCPPESTAEIVTHASSTDGGRRPATSYAMQCVDANGNVVKEPSPDYFFIWLGVLGIIGLILSALTAFLLAAPAGVIVAKLTDYLRKVIAR